MGCTMEQVERDLILETLGHTLGNRTHAAVILGISIRALRNKLRDYTRAGWRCRHQPIRPKRWRTRCASLGDRAKPYLPGTTLAWLSVIIALLAVLIVPLPAALLDFGLALSVTASVLVLMVAVFLGRPLDFTSFPTLLLLTTLLRLSLNVATTRLILSRGNEGPARQVMSCRRSVAF